MDQNIVLFTLVYFSLLTIWLFVASYFLYKTYASISFLSKGVNVSDITKVLHKIFEKEKNNDEKIARVAHDLNNLTQQSLFAVQKVGVVRFNPFKELGGDHSFSLALLDKENTGIILTGLHTRERTRVYLKDIEKGKTQYSLSNEEKKALKLAINK
ncbi:DUF4446 family protein [Candidatus Woesebacteria bacterium]|nr:MAG: DUF4446 family protein [Candidatus Woesebacteria bacterium]